MLTVGNDLEEQFQSVGTCLKGFVELRGSSYNDEARLASFRSVGYHYGVWTSVEGLT